MILGLSPNVDGHSLLLLMRFHNSSRLRVSNKEIQCLYQALRDECGKGGHEARRTGGSSGQTKINKQFSEFLNYPSNFPVKCKGIKFMKLKHTWKCFYLSRLQDGKFVSVDYTQPHGGGNFELPNHFYDLFKFFPKFTLSKATAALILEVYNLDKDVKVQPKAIANELKNIALSRSKENKVCVKDFVKVFNTSNRHTLVTHPVGYHRDVFAYASDGNSQTI